ncbi:rod shape-determining protein MreD [Aureitalea sp. L0-47]|uniref:rod shape-determining protein MreD n=1 Tax=Aureitalea sp. L0-47 TaxID=2816962 RepID=UPI002236F9E3|nr:rod shape-determining protein MreD [Aureitalea sp. L0-47]MCW5518711.1 rod shape-determining protein MreD [Aureitalea sp. L0-47]
MWNNEALVNAVRFIVLVLVQVILLNNINLFGYVNPYLYVLFIIVYPFSGNKSLLIGLAFVLGLSIDIFSDSGGIHAAACSFLAYVRPAFLKVSFGVSYEYNMVKISTAAIGERLTYISLMVFTHHLILFSLEIFNFNHILLILKSTLFSGIFSVVLIFCTILLFSRRS